jgi:hypothetical protein
MFKGNQRYLLISFHMTYVHNLTHRARDIETSKIELFSKYQKKLIDFYEI